MIFSFLFTRAFYHKLIENVYFLLLLEKSIHFNFPRVNP